MRRRNAIVLGLLVVALVMTVLLWPRGAAKRVEAAATTTSTTEGTTTTVERQRGFQAADAVQPEVPVYPAPDGSGDPIVTLTNPTSEDVPLTMLVKQQGPTGWLEVQYNKRPNEASGWIRASDVAVREVKNRIVIGVAAKQLTVYRGSGDEVLFQAAVATGLPQTPTPLGEFYVDVVIQLIHPTGVYGPYQLSVAGFSDVLQSFGGGPGQIAIHGTNQPQLIGTEASNGCIRLTNEDITTLATLAPAGTPVSIVA